MRNKEIRFITEVAIMSALGLIFDFIGGLYSKFIWPMGGSISFVLIPIVIMAFRWGLKGGLITGLIVGTVQIIWAGTGAVYPLQTVMDYVVAYTLVGFAGIFSKKMKAAETIEGKLYYSMYGIIIGGTLRTLTHIVSGYIFFLEWAPDYFKTTKLMGWSWSIIYNLGYMVPSIILTLIIVNVLIKKYPEHLLYTEEVEI